MPKGFGNMNQLFKQAEAMQKKMAKMQEELGEKQVSGSAGGNMVQVTVNGKQELLSIKIEAAVLKDNDVEMLQDLVLAAVNDGLNRSREMVSEAMGAITGGMNLPGLF